MICYDDQTRLKTAVELLNATRDIEMQVDKVSCRTKEIKKSSDHRHISHNFCLFYVAGLVATVDTSWRR